jgi:hypothetical protein
VNGDARQIVSTNLALTGVQSAPNLETHSARPFSHRHCAPDAAHWTVEGSQEAVSSILDVLPPEPVELSFHHRVVIVQEVAPSAVAQVGSAPC